MFVDSKIAKNIVVGRSKLKYEINKGINPYLLEVSLFLFFFLFNNLIILNITRIIWQLNAAI